MSQSPNPFCNRGVITDPDDFFGRENQITEIITRLGTMQSTSVVGERRIGKSSLLYHLCQTGVRRLNDASYRFCYVDLQDAHYHTALGFFQTVLHKIEASSDVIKPENSLNGNLVAFSDQIDSLKRAGQQLVFCLDEFENTFKHREQFSEDFFDHMRAQLNVRKMALVTATRHRLQDYQRRAAQRALVDIIVQDLQEAGSFENVATAPMLLEVLPSDVESLPSGLDDAARHIRKVAELASDYLTRVTPSGQMSVLKELLSAVDSFRDAMVLIKPPVGPAFQATASRWLEIVKAEEARVRERIAFEPIPNPFVVGNPLMVRDHNLFKGRKDIIVAIEENIINPSQRPALLLYGRRRIGKTSTLLNLSRLLSSQFVPVFIDCQDAKWREGDEVFCYHLAAQIHDALNQRALVETTRRPQLERFERYAFTRLGEYLDQIEESSRAANKQILLTFDEYEKLEEGITASKLTTEVLNQLRTIVQHRERIVVLFSGGHRFEEMKTINWSDYLINVKTLELSYLAPEDARELITEPVPLLQYEPGVIERIIEVTHCQPYLLQAVASDLVNYLNSERRMLATAADLDIAVEKVLVTVQSYFFYTWTGDCSEAEREILRMIATGDTNGLNLAERQASLESLCHKEILERQGSGYRFNIELFRRWVLKNQTSQPLTPGDLREPAELEYPDLQTTHT